MKKVEYNDEELYQFIFQDKLSYEEIGRKYNVSSTAIKQHAIKLGWSLPQRRKINPNEFTNKVSKRKIRYCLECGKELGLTQNKNIYCSLQCQSRHRHKILYQKIIDGAPEIMSASYNPITFKQDILREQNNVCAICGMTQEWNGKPIVFIIDHIDGRASNNKRSNLRCICPNCDSQLDTYKAKNKHGERVYYHKHHR